MGFDALVEYIREIANKKLELDPEDAGSTSAYEISGGNYDDAYYSGTEDGEVFLACRLLRMLENNP